MPLYERIQLHAYMRISKTKTALLVEGLNGDKRHHDVDFDDELWASVLSETRSFVATLLGELQKQDQADVADLDDKLQPGNVFA